MFKTIPSIYSDLGLLILGSLYLHYYPYISIQYGMIGIIYTVQYTLYRKLNFIKY